MWYGGGKKITNLYVELYGVALNRREGRGWMLHNWEIENIMFIVDFADGKQGTVTLQQRVGCKVFINISIL